jgi:hypothetical protein
MIMGGFILSIVNFLFVIVSCLWSEFLLNYNKKSTFSCISD